MNQLIQVKLSHSPSKHLIVLIALALACFAVSRSAQAVSPAPDGTYPGFNVAEGANALLTVTTGTFNTAIGFNTLRSDTNGGHNTAVGNQALFSNSTGNANTAVGENALVHNTTGSANMALGQGALSINTTGNFNTAMGFQALGANTASNNVAVGTQALRNNTTGDENVAIGFQALFNNTTAGHASNAVGFQALFNSTGPFNNAFGWEALTSVTSGNRNAAIGDEAGNTITTGNGNTCLGADTCLNVVTASGVTCIGQAVGGADVNGTTWVANTFGVTTQSATTMPVIVSNNGQLGTAASSERFKHDIKPMAKTSEAILALKPVTFHYKNDTSDTPQFGLVAEEVAKVNPDLIVRDDKGEIYSVRYDAVNAMLLNEFLKEHKRVQELRSSDAGQKQEIAELRSTIAQQQKGMEALAAQVKEQNAKIEKASAQLEMNKPATQLVESNQLKP